VLRAGSVDRRAPVGDGEDAVACALERLAQRLSQRGLVVAHQDVERLGGHRGRNRICHRAQRRCGAIAVDVAPC
jgi:hypothetical protein